MQIDLSEFNEELSSISNRIKEKVKRLEEEMLLDESLYEFQLDNYENSKIVSLKETEGIYIFYIKRDILDDFKKKWGEKIGRHSPKIIEEDKRIDKHKNGKSEWIPLYIGKSKKVKSRIKEHITLKKKQTTSSMKLRERKEFDKDKFAIRIIPLNTEHYDFIAHPVESELRKLLNPIVGKK